MQVDDALATLANERQSRANQCHQELSVAIAEVLQKHNCKLEVAMLLTERGAIPQFLVNANPLGA